MTTFVRFLVNFSFLDMFLYLSCFKTFIVGVVQPINKFRIASWLK
uniref:Uncharacterized protein n=1 Tax=Rhizophora mucronata TaxID=61149 RepID=A0A2P2Q892_RHIMU